MATLTIHHYLDIIDSFVRNVTNTSKSYYMFIARPYPWLDADGNVDETAVVASNSSVYQHESSIYQDMAFGKLIDDQNVSYMIQRYDWTSGTVYDQYDQLDGDLYAKKYFVMTDNYEVYKCIDNNGRAQSTVKPTLNSTYGTFKTGDGYTWKYMYAVESNANTKFTSPNFIPVTQNSDVITNAIGGTVDAVRLTDGGSDYRTYYAGFLKSVSNNYHVILDANAAHTDNYYKNSSIYLKSGFGAGQLRKITDYKGIQRQVRVETPFETFITFNVTDRTGDFIVGDILTQNVDVLSSSYFQGSFNPFDNIVQSDTGANGTIISANTTEVRIIRKSPATAFSLAYSYRNTNDTGVQKSGNSTVVSFARLPVVSNTGAFTLGEYVYQANSTANVAVGILQRASIVESFNANSSVNGVEDFINITNNLFEDNDAVVYSTASGNTPITTLSNNATYYIVQANTAGVKLSATQGGANLNLTASTRSESGHYLKQTPLTLTIGRSNGQFVVNSTVYTVRGNTSGAVATISSVQANTEGRKLIYSTNTSYTNFTSEYAVGNFIRVGGDANNNIRRITSVNSSVIGVDLEFSANLVSNTHWLVPSAAEPISIGYMYSNGSVSNTNLNGVILQLADVENQTILGTSYFVGETIDMVDANRVKQGVTATVSYANNVALVLTNVTGVFYPNYYIVGESSYQFKSITDVIAYPTVTIKDPINYFLYGQRIFSRSSADLNTVHGSANIASFYVIPNEQTEYYISPTVTIDGDGENALAYSIVNDSDVSTNNISQIVVIDPGHGYTHANVTITANAVHGHGAKAGPVISPVLGHGSDALSELNSRYVGVTMTFDTGVNEDYKFPVYGDYRRVGIIENPLFEDVYVTLNSFDRATLAVNISSSHGAGPGGGGFRVGEIIYQPNTSFSGVVSFANSSKIEVKNARGEFSWNGHYANSLISNDNIIGLSSNTYANVILANTNYFTVSPGIEIASETASGANAVIVTPLSNTYVKITDVGGRFDVNDTMYDTLSNAYANVVAIATVNGHVDVSYSFGKKFNQTMRFPLTTNTAAFTQFEYIRQENTNAAARVISNNNYDFDIKYAGASGTFNIDNTITDSYTLAAARVVFANSTYLRITASNGTFANNSTITNNLGVTALTTNSFPVLVLTDVSGANKFQVGDRIFGLTSGAVGNCAMYDTIVYPELKPNSGTVTYIENVEPFQLSNTSKENFKLVIKF